MCSSPKLLFLCVFMQCLVCSVPATAQIKVPFTFNLASGASTSAGVYAKDGTLLKTLWNGVRYSAGAQTASWDGMGDDGRLLANGDYDIRVLSNNVAYTWDGVIGNTSDSYTGTGIHRGYLRMYGMAIAGSYAYYCNYYNEGHSSQYKFSLSNPQKKIELSTFGQGSMYVATDGNNVYWAGDDVLGGHSKWFVYASATADDAETVFANGQGLSVTYGKSYASAIDITYSTNANISGMAVQKAGSYLFVSRQNLNEVHVINKTTGALVRVINTVVAPNRLAVDGNDNLWIVSGSSIQKYAVNGDGSLGAVLVTLNGIANPQTIAVSPDNSIVLVADGGNSQQLKAFDNNTGNTAWTYGQPGGYATDATVTDDKFYFTDQRHSNDGTFLAYQPDGSFWVEDAGNFRTQHFSQNRTFIDRIMYLPAFYGGSADPNNPSRVFSDQLEFSVDYSKPLGPNNGSWVLTKNWEAYIPSDYTDRLHSVTTFPNGRTYAFLLHGSKYALVELLPVGGLRITGFETNDLKFDLQKDASIIGWGQVPLGDPFGFNVFTLSGFDGSNNPIWAPGVQVARSEPITAADPAFHGSGNIVKTSSDVFISFDAGLPPNSSTNYHLGGVKAGTNKWAWKAAKSTFKEYNGPFPNDGAYDIGNAVEYAGSMAVVLDKTIVWGYHGEFWKGGETNFFNHVNDDGLLISQFGTSGSVGANAYAGLAGNTISLAMVKDASGNGYLYHNDESAHGGLHRWKITGLETIQEQTIPVTLAPATGGLLCQYYEGPDLNNLNIKSTKVNTTVNNNPLPAAIINPIGSSSRWTGFISANANDMYTFYTSVNKGIRVWIDGNLVINNWANTSPVEISSGQISLDASKKYSVIIEMLGGSAILSWSGNSLSKQIVPSGNLIPAALPDSAAGIDLLEGLPFKSILEDNLYGWRRDLKWQDTTGLIYNNWWSIKTSVQAYKKPDVYVRFVQADKNVVYTVTRDLGDNAGDWKLSGHISHDNDSPGPIDNPYIGGSFNVLDNNGRTIATLVSYINYSTGDEFLYGNNHLIAQDKADVFDQVWRNVQPIEITGSNGLISIAFGPYPKITVPIADPLSNWLSPKTMALYFRSAASNGTRAADIVDMRFFGSGLQILLPLDIISFKAANLPDYVSLQWATENEKNASSFTVERSADGNSFSMLGTEAAKNAAGTNNYNFYDKSPLSGTGYYRLKIFDTDGKFRYSNIVSVNRKTTARFSVYPNPAENVLHIDYPAMAENGSLEIISGDGKKIKDISIIPGSTGKTINVDYLNAGYYFIKLKNGTSTLTTGFLKK